MNPRAKRLALICAGVLAGVVLLLAAIYLYQREPAYNGKRLSTWAQQYGSNKWSVNQAAAKEAELAIRNIGTNSIPFLLDLMRATDTPLKKKLRGIVPEQWHVALHLKDQSSRIRRIGAHGLTALGTNAPAAVEPLVEIATHHPDQDGRYIAVFTLSRLAPASESAVPFLIQCLTNQESIIRNEGATGLVLIPNKWQTSLPALIDYLERTRTFSDSWEAMHAVSLLAQLGTNAKPAMPLLISMLDHPDQAVREALTNHLWRIDAEAAARAHLRRVEQ